MRRKRKGKRTLMSVPTSEAKGYDLGARRGQGSKITLRQGQLSRRGDYGGSYAGLWAGVLSAGARKRVPEESRSRMQAGRCGGRPIYRHLDWLPVTELWLDGGVTGGCGDPFWETGTGYAARCAEWMRGCQAAGQEGVLLSAVTEGQYRRSSDSRMVWLRWQRGARERGGGRGCGRQEGYLISSVRGRQLESSKEETSVGVRL